jgi:hypothetical protein
VETPQVDLLDYKKDKRESGLYVDNGGSLEEYLWPDLKRGLLLMSCHTVGEIDFDVNRESGKMKGISASL